MNMDNVYLAGLMDPRLHRSATPAISSAQPLPPTPGGGLHGMPAHPHLGHHHWPPVSTGLPPSLNPPPPSPVGYPHLSPGMGDPRSVMGPGSHGPGGNPFYHPQFSLLDAHHHHQRMAAESHRINMAHAEVARMAEVQRVLEDSRKKEAAARAAAAAANVTTSSFQFTGSSLSSLVASSSATREPLFSHGLSPLDRGGLYPSHGGILDPLSTSIPHPSGLPSPRGGMSLTSPSSSLPKPKMFSPYESSPTTSSGPLLKPTPSVPFRPFGPPSHSEPSHCPLSASFMGTNTSVVSTTGTMSSVLSSDATPRPISSLRENDHKIVKLDKPEEPEEVLVDDFDGQCCRTYPYNHSRIQRWQREHAEKRRHRKDVSAPPSVDRSSAREQKGAENSAATSGTERSQSGSRRSEHLSGAVGSNSASLRSASADGRRDTSLGSNLQHQKSVSEANLPATTGSIPVGIAIGRQRQQESLDFKRAEDLSRAAAAASNSGTSSQCGPHGEKYGTMMNPQGVSPLGAHGPMRWPHPPSGSPMWPPSHVPPGTPSPGGYPSIPPWMPPGLVGAPPQMGPIPMGYQLAKDPLTGQILLIPTDVANNPPPHGAWPTPPSPYEQQPSGMSHFTSLGPPPATPPVSSSAAVAHFHQMYMHQQMYMQQAAAAAHHHAASASKGMYRPPLPSVRRLEPETITVSDDDDEPHQKRTTTSSSADGMRHTREIEDPNAAFDRLFDSVRPRDPEKEPTKPPKEEVHASDIIATSTNALMSLNATKASSLSSLTTLTTALMKTAPPPPHALLPPPPPTTTTTPTTTLPLPTTSKSTTVNEAAATTTDAAAIISPPITTTLFKSEVNPATSVASLDREKPSKSTTKFDVISLTTKQSTISKNLPNESTKSDVSSRVPSPLLTKIKTEPRLSTDSKLEEESSETICSKNVDISSELPPKSLPSQEDLIVKDDVVPKSEEEETVIKTEPIEANVTKCPSPPLSPTLNPSTQEDVEEEPPLNQMVPQEPMPEKSSLQEDCEEIARELLFFSENERFHGEDLRATRDDPADLSPLKILLEAIDISEKNKHFEAQPQCIGFSEGITALCQITQTDLLPLGLQSKFLDLNHINIKLLCTVTATDLDELRSRVDPLQTWNEIYNLHQYSCDEAEVSVKDFIANKIKQYPPPNPVTLNLAIDGVSTDIALGVGLELTTPKEDNYMGIKSLAKIVKQIKNTDIMSQLEVELRGQLAEIQTLYREKHREMTRLKLNTPKKGSAKGGGRSKRGPGRPKKRKLTSKGKTKMGRPRKTKLPSTESRPGGEFEDLSPPILEPCATPPTLESQIKVEPMARSRSNSPNTKNEGGDQLLKPPKLTASLIPSRANSNSVTNLSTINAKFMKGKANPFANLLSKLATGSTCGGSASSQHSKQNSEDEDENEEVQTQEEPPHPTSDDGGRSEDSHHERDSDSREDENDDDDDVDDDKDNDDEDNEDNEEEVEERHDNEQEYPSLPTTPLSFSKKSGSRRNSTSSSHSLSHKSNYSSHSTRKDSDEEANSSSKKRKADKPRKHTGSTETIVPKKPRNLFMMNCLNLQREFKSTSAAAAHSSSMRDEYDFTDDEEERGGGDHPTHILGSLVASKGEGPSATSGSKPTQMCGGSLLFTEYRSPPHGTSSPPPTTSSASTSSTLFSKGNKPWKDQKKSKSPKNVGSFNNSNLNSPIHKGISSSVLASSPTPSSKSKEKKHKSSVIESPASKAGVISATTSTLSPSGTSAPPPSALPSTSSTATPTTMAIEGAVAEYALPSSSTGQTALRTATLKASDLKDGLRFLWLDNGRFHPARLNSTPLDDIYSVTMEKQRSNRPDIMPRDDVLNLGIFELRPLSKKQLPIGTRVCVYWSQAYNYLFPGTVDLTEVPFKETMVEVFLDDGDRRQVDIVNVRMLPPNYSHVVPAPDPLDTRKRRQSNDSADANHDLHHPRIQPLYQRKGSLSPSPAKKCKQIAPITTPHGKLNKKRHKHKHCSKKRHKHYHKKSYPPPPTETIYEEKEDERHRDDLSDEDDDCEESPDEESGNLRIKLDGSFNNTTTYSIRSPMYQTRTTSEESNHGDDEIGEDSSDESGSESESGGETDKAASRVSGINPVTGRPFWRWVEGDEGYRRPGKKGGKAKKLFHRAIQRDSEILNVGDCAVFLSTARVDRPYIGRVELLWETWNGNMMVKVKWFYHPEEIETSGKNFDLKVPGGLFQSPHTDENDVQTISHKCQVLPLREYSRVLISDPVKRRKLFSNSDTYYLAGSYDPTNMSVNFQSGVLKNSS